MVPQTGPREATMGKRDGLQWKTHLEQEDSQFSLDSKVGCSIARLAYVSEGTLQIGVYSVLSTNEFNIKIKNCF